MQWRLPDHCARGLQLASKSLLVSKRDFWADDVLQAGRIALWKRAPDSVGLAYTVARGAMCAEMRRLTPGQRMVNDRGCRGLDLIFVGLIEADDGREGGDCPAALLEARQLLARLEAKAPGWPAALAESEDLRGAGARMGVSESRACQVRRWLQVTSV